MFNYVLKYLSQFEIDNKNIFAVQIVYEILKLTKVL